MVSVPLTLPVDYWKTLKINNKDLDFLHSHLFEIETPLTATELLGEFIGARIKSELDSQSKKMQGQGKVYVPAEHYAKGDKLTFPALDWTEGTVTGVRPGVNPQFNEFEVVTVAMKNGNEQLFAAGLADHDLNNASASESQDKTLNPKHIQSTYGDVLVEKLEAAFDNDPELVRIAGRWFPRTLLVDVSPGHLNLAEAALDVAHGEPLPTIELLKDVELPEKANMNLAEFSLNLALQDDKRFDEVGPAGEILWCLKRLEPDNVQNVPEILKYSPIEYDRSLLTDEAIALEAKIDDEYGEAANQPEQEENEVTICLIYPHWRAGTLPITPLVQSMFPTAYISARVRFTLVDKITGQKIPAWVVRKERYVCGLREWYKTNKLMPGSLIRIVKSNNRGEVVVEAKTHHTTKDWVRTVIIGADGGIVFALLKQPVTAELNDRMAFAVPALEAADQLWDSGSQKKMPFDTLVTNFFRELIKLNTQGHIHAQELYAAINIVRRVPFGPLMAHLAANPQKFVHIGDLHYRIGEEFQD